MDLTGLPRPTVKLVGKDGNIFNLIALTMKALNKAGWSREQRDRLVMEVSASGSYHAALGVIQKYADVR